MIKLNSLLTEIKRGEYATIYDMKKEMKEGKFDPKNPNINVHGLYTVHLKLLEKMIKRDLKHKPLQSKIKGLWEVYQQMNTSQYKRAVTMYKKKR